MATHKSAKKTIRQSKKVKLLRNTAKGKVKSVIKQFQSQVKAEDKEKAQKTLHQIQSLIDKATSKRIFHPRTAARYKSRLNLKLKSLKS